MLGQGRVQRACLRLGARKAIQDPAFHPCQAGGHQFQDERVGDQVSPIVIALERVAKRGLGRDLGPDQIPD